MLIRDTILPNRAFAKGESFDPRKAIGDFNP